jgi:RNA polymerase primary sigma factor
VPSDTDIARKLKLSPDKVEQINFWMSTTTSSLEAPIGEDNDNQVSDLVEDQNAIAPDAEIEHLLDRERIDNLLEVMKEREREILDMRFGLNKNKPQTLAEVAKKLGVSRERVRQIEEAALRKLRKFVVGQEKEI